MPRVILAAEVDSSRKRSQGQASEDAARQWDGNLPGQSTEHQRGREGQMKRVPSTPGMRANTRRYVLEISGSFQKLEVQETLSGVSGAQDQPSSPYREYSLKPQKQNGPRPEALPHDKPAHTLPASTGGQPSSPSCLTFNHSLPGGRLGGLSGQWVPVLNPQPQLINSV